MVLETDGTIPVNALKRVINDTIASYISAEFQYKLKVDIVSNDGDVIVTIAIIYSDDTEINKGDIISETEQNLDREFGEGSVKIIDPFSTTNDDNGAIKTTNDSDDSYIYIIIGCIGGIVITIIIICIFWRKQNKTKADEDHKAMKLAIDSPKATNGTNTNIQRKGSNSDQLYDKHDGITANGAQTKGDSSDDEMYNGINLTTKGIRVASIESDAVELASIDNAGFYVKCIAHYVASDEDQLNLEEGEIIFIMKTLDSGWWYGIDSNDNDGWIPSNYVKRLEESQEQQQQARKNGSLYVYGNNYATNLDKYLNYALPPKVVPMVVSDYGDDAQNEDYSKDSDKVTNDVTTVGNDRDSSEDDNDKMYDKDNVVTKRSEKDEDDSDSNSNDEMYQQVNTTK